MSIRDNLDISAYLVLGPENTLGRPVGNVVAQALDAGFTCSPARLSPLRQHRSYPPGRPATRRQSHRPARPVRSPC